MKKTFNHADKAAFAQKRREEARDELAALAGMLQDPKAVGEFLMKKKFTMNQLGDQIPCLAYSILNQLSIFRAGFTDARGFNQWRAVGRSVIKGERSRCFIFVPFIKRREDETTGETSSYVDGYKLQRVFGYEQTEGEELAYTEELNQRTAEIKSFPLADLAEEMGVTVEAGFSRYGEDAYFQTSGRIVVCTDAEQDFFHELAHAIDHELGTLGGPGNQLDEVVAEFTACYIARTVGMTADMADTAAYVKNWSKTKPVAEMLTKALGRAVEIVSYIAAWESERVAVEA